MMRRFALTFIAALAFASAVFAGDWDIHDISVNVRLYKDGSAVVKEIWDLTAESGTEVYVPRENLGGSEISGLSVMDEEGVPFKFEEDWDVDWSFKHKAGRCGFNRTSSGVELCWGLGSYGRHQYTVQYLMTDAVRSLNDYDYLHMQLVNDEMDFPPAHVKVSIEAVDSPLDTSWVRMWGFGYEGTTGFEDGKAVFESTEHFQYMSSVIALLRFDKGVFGPGMSVEKDFQEVLDGALVGADFGTDAEPEPFWKQILSALSSLLFFVLIPLFAIAKLANAGRLSRRQKRKILGSDPEKVDWYRDIPYDGDIYMTDFVLNKFEVKRQSNAIASAIILRLLQKGYLVARKDDKGRVEILFDQTKDPSGLGRHERGLYDMMKEASGSDIILQDKEFSRWSASNAHKAAVRSWADGIEKDARASIVASGDFAGLKFTPKGYEGCRRVFGFKNFLRDYTLVNIRESAEVGLWQDYMVYAALFGIADKVAKELKDINPQAFEEVVVYDYPMMNDVIRMTNNMARSITNARYVQPSTGTASSSWGGFGGHSSFGGGGGFYGGGHGGGVR